MKPNRSTDVADVAPTRRGSPPEKIVLSDIIVRFGTVTALDRFSASVHSGVTGLLGPNGAGKSTMIKTVLGLVHPDSGSIRVRGLDPHQERVRVRDMIGYMPEHDCLVSSMNPVSLVSYMARISGLPKKDSISRTHEMLDFVGIGEERYRDIGSYSTGMKQKVKLAQAIVHDPGIVFLDEPTNGLDPRGRDEMLALIRKLGETGKTILVSSHILHEIEQVSKHLILINRGRLVRQGSMEELIEGDRDHLLIKVRGDDDPINDLITLLRDRYSVISTRNEFGQMAIVLKGVDSTSSLFEITRSEAVQVRYIGPDRQTLEDLFIRTIEADPARIVADGPPSPGSRKVRKKMKRRPDHGH